MTTRVIDFAAECESHRCYLTTRANAHVGPHLRGKLDPADLVQQTLLRACQGRDSFRGEGAGQLRVWLKRILANIITDSLRKFGGGHGRDRSLDAMLDESSGGLGGLLQDAGSSPSHKASREERLALLSAALGRLSEDQRMAVELKHLHGEPLDRIAERMGKTGPAVAGLLRRGLGALRSTLAALA